MADNLLSSFLPDDRASFGIFPQMKPKRRFQDPTGAANVPLDVTRGRVAGLAGLLPDVLNFMGRSPMPTEQFGETQYEPAQHLPYGSEYFLQNLPLKPTSRIGEVAGQAGAFVPLNPMPAARAVAAGVKALGPTAVRMGEGYLQSKGLMPGVVPEAPVTPATPLASMIEKPQAPVSELGFYSAAEQAALNLPRKSGTGESFLNDLMKGQDVKKDELSWMGLDDYLKGKPNVTRQEVQDFIASNRVDVQERQLGGVLSPEMQTTKDALTEKYKGLVDNIADAKSQFEEGKISYAQLRDTVSNNKAQIEELDIHRRIDEIDKTIPPTKYQQYQLPGGENYREILLTLPKQSLTTNDIATKLFGKEMRYLSEAEKDAVIVEARRIEDTTPKDYTSSHFNEPNILAHMRVNDRVDADGKKMLLIEEIQSDWHQAGREKGYNTPEKRAAEQKKLDDLIVERQQLGERQKQLEELASPYTSQGKDAPTNILDEWNSVSNRLQRLQTEQNRLGRTTGEGVTDAPFKDTWHQLALKRALKYAADNGYDRVGLTTGSQQAKRYDLSKQVDEIAVPMVNSDGSRSVRIEPTEGGNIKLMVDSNGVVTGYGSGSTQFSGKKLNEVLGKEIADKVMNAQANAKFSGLDLQVGGEGMKKYYDEIYPAFLAKQGKKYNAKTGETRISTGRSNVGGMLSMYPDKETIRYIDISPEMRGGVKKGQPLFTAAPIGGIGLGAGTQDQQQNSINSFIQ